MGNNESSKKHYQVKVNNQNLDNSAKTDTELAWQYYRQGKAFAKDGYLKEALECVNKAIELVPGSPIMYNFLGEIQAKTGQKEFAILSFQKAISIKGNLLLPYKNLGNIWLEYGELSQARECFEKAISLDKNFAQAYCGMGLVLVQNKQYDEAIKYYIKALKCRNILGIYEHLGVALEKKGLTKESKLCCKNKNIPVNILKRYGDFSQDYSVINKNIHSSDQEVSYVEIYPSEQSTLLTPITIHKQINSDFSKTQVFTKEVFVSILKNAQAYAESMASVVVSSSNQILEDISTGHSNLVVASGKLYKPYILNGKVAFLSSKWGSSCYFHWMLEILPRIELLRKIGIKLESIDNFVLYQSNRKFNLDTLNQLGIPQTKIIDSYDYPYIQAKQLLTPSIIGGVRGSQWVLDFLRQTFLDSSSSCDKSSKFIYISRRNALGRRVINEEEVTELLSKYGFECVLPESMSVKEQASLLSQAKVVITPHGSGLTNIVFCKPGTKIIELFSPDYINPCYWQLSNKCNLEYYYLLGQNLTESKLKPYKKEEINRRRNTCCDLLIDLNELEKTLAIAGFKR